MTKTEIKQYYPGESNHFLIEEIKSQAELRDTKIETIIND